MADRKTPGVYITEVDAFPPSIVGVSTGVAGFIGMTAADPGGPPQPITSWGDYEQLYGDAAPLAVSGGSVPNLTALAVQAFFRNGGETLYIGRAANASLPAYAAALATLQGIAEISILAVPDAAQFDPAFVTEIHRMLIADAERAGRFAVLDTPVGSDMTQARATRAAIESDHAALYTPWLRIADPDDPARTIDVPPSGTICGLYVQTDTTRGVYKAPANLAIVDAVPVRAINDGEQEVLNPEGINVIRTFPERGTRLWGARTLSRDPEWKYVSTRRYMTYLGKSLTAGLAWTAFEPNAAPLWTRVTAMIEGFLFREWQIGGLIGAKPEQAFVVQCGTSTMTAADIAAGRLIAQLGVAMIRPAEFMVFRIDA